MNNNKNKTQLDKNIICVIIIVFCLPIILAIGLAITDYCFLKFGWTLSPSGLGNREWLQFFQNYLIGITAIFSALLVWRASKDEIKSQRRLEQNRHIIADIDKERQVLVGVCKAFDTAVIYHAFNVKSELEVAEGIEIIQHGRDKALTSQIEFEMLTLLPRIAENGSDSLYHLIADSLVKTYYDTLKLYHEVLNNGDSMIQLIKRKNYINQVVINIKSQITITENCIVELDRIIGDPTGLNFRDYTKWDNMHRKDRTLINENKSKILQMKIDIEEKTKEIASIDARWGELLERVHQSVQDIQNNRAELIRLSVEYINLREKNELVDL